MFNDLVKKAQNPNPNIGVTPQEKRVATWPTKPKCKKHLYKGKYYTIQGIADLAGISYQAAATRLHKWKDVDKAVEYPGFKKRKSSRRNIRR